jgi:MerR family mercuric resistance operon transcriptional regulator
MRTRSTALGIGRLSQQSGCNIETIRYYERIGLMPRATRTAGGHRQYEEPGVRRLGFIRRSRELGFTLDQIRSLLALVDGGRYTCGQVKRITDVHLDEVRRKVIDLRKIERVLQHMVDQCVRGTVPECAVIDALFDKAPTPPATRSSRQHLGVPSRRSPARGLPGGPRRFSLSESSRRG